MQIGADTAGLADGDIAISVVHNDRSGNSKTVTGQVVRDSIEPRITLSKPGASDTYIPLADLSSLNAYSIEGNCSHHGKNLSIEVFNGHDTSISETPLSVVIREVGVWLWISIPGEKGR